MWTAPRPGGASGGRPRGRRVAPVRRVCTAVSAWQREPLSRPWAAPRPPHTDWVLSGRGRGTKGTGIRSESAVFLTHPGKSRGPAPPAPAAEHRAQATTLGGRSRCVGSRRPGGSPPLLPFPLGEFRQQGAQGIGLLPQTREPRANRAVVVVCPPNPRNRGAAGAGLWVLGAQRLCSVYAAAPGFPGFSLR